MTYPGLLPYNVNNAGRQSSEEALDCFYVRKPLVDHQCCWKFSRNISIVDQRHHFDRAVLGQAFNISYIRRVADALTKASSHSKLNYCSSMKGLYLRCDIREMLWSHESNIYYLKYYFN